MTAGLAGLCCSLSCPADLLIFDEFDNDDLATGGPGAVNGGFAVVANAPGSGSTATEAGTLASATSIGANANAGIQSLSAVDVLNETLGLTVRIVVDSLSAQPQSNGMFLGLQDSAGTFHRDDTMNFGFSFFGQEGRQDSSGGYSFLFNDINSGNPADEILDTGADLQATSLLDGFTAEFTIDPGGWAYALTGLSDGSGVPTTFSNTGVWSSPTFYADNFDDQEYVSAMLQKAGTGSNITHAYDSVTVDAIPEPGSLALVLPVALLLLTHFKMRLRRASPSS